MGNTTYDVIGKGLMGAVADRIDLGRVGALMITHDEWAYDLEARHFSAQLALAS